MTYDKTPDVLTILDQAVVHIAPDERARTARRTSPPAPRCSRGATSIVRFERAVRMQRGGQIIEADTVRRAPQRRREAGRDRRAARARADHRRRRSSPGGLQALSGREMNLKYAADGESLQHALVAGDASIQLAGEAGKPGRQIVATHDRHRAGAGRRDADGAARPRERAAHVSAGARRRRADDPRRDARREGRAGQGADARAVRRRRAVPRARRATSTARSTPARSTSA